MHPPVLLIHGMWCTSYHWQAFKQALEALGYRCFAPTLPFHDEHQHAHSAVAKLSLQAYVTYLEAYVKTEMTEPPIVIGHSMGGLLAALLATRITTRALVMLAPVQPRGVNVLNLGALPTMWKLIKKGAWLCRAHKPSAGWASHVLFNDLPAENHTDLYQHFVFESGKALFQTALWPLDFSLATSVKIHQIKAPVYVLAGAKDAIMAPDIMQKTADYYGATYKIYDAFGHWLIDKTRTDVVVADIDNWIKSHVYIR